MVRDEVDVRFPPRVVSKRAYWGLIGVLFVAATVAEYEIGRSIEQQFGRTILRYLGGITIWNLALARSVADAILRRRGLSLSGPTVREWARAGASPADPIGPRAEVEVEVWRRSHEGLLIVGFVLMVASIPFLGLALGKLARHLAGRSWDQWPTTVSLLGGALLTLGIGGLGLWFVIRAATPQRRFRADAAGLTDDCAGRFLPWSDIATCRIITQHDTFGTPTEVVHELTDSRGEVCHRLELDTTPQPDRDRLLHFIQARLPKPVKDDWG